MSSTELVIADDQRHWNQVQQAALVQMGVDQASEADLQVFFHVCKIRRLDPFSKQIYMIGRRDHGKTKYTIQTSIDGYRLIARRAADVHHETFGYEDTLWCDGNGNWHDVWFGGNHPVAAKVVVVKGDGTRFPAVAAWDEYVQTKFEGGPNAMWSKMGANQLAKCAEALALRKAYPEDLGGIYTDDEMGQADNTAQPVQQFTQQPSEPPRDYLALAQAAGGDFDSIRNLFMDARENGVPNEILAQIKALGDEAYAMRVATAPDPADDILEQAEPEAQQA